MRKVKSTVVLDAELHRRLLIVGAERGARGIQGALVAAARHWSNAEAPSLEQQVTEVPPTNQTGLPSGLSDEQSAIVERLAKLILLDPESKTIGTIEEILDAWEARRRKRPRPEKQHEEAPEQSHVDIGKVRTRRSG